MILFCLFYCENGNFICCILYECLKSYFFFFQIVLQGHATRVTPKSQQSGEKAFRCKYDGCGKLYTTAHHLKVEEKNVGVTSILVADTACMIELFKSLAALSPYPKFQHIP